MNLKAVIIDLDGTLLNDNKEISNKDYEILKQLGNKNIFRIIATGRSLHSFYQVLNDDFPIDYLIFDAGAGIIDFRTKKIIKSNYIKSDDVKKIAKKLDKLKIDFQLRELIPNSHKYKYKKYSKHNPDFDRINSLYKKYIEEFKDFADFQDSSRFICISPNNKFVDIIEKEFKDFSVIRATSPIDNNSVWMEIYLENVNKGNAVIYLCKKLNINLINTIGIGNDYNDIHFLDITGKSYIVSNSPESLKQKYQVICSNNESPLVFLLKK